MKTMITTYLDGELVTEARAKGVKFSEFFNNSLKALLEMGEDDPEESDIEDLIVNAKARLMSLHAEKDREEKEKSKRYGEEKEL